MLAKNKLNSVLSVSMFNNTAHVLVFDSGVGGLSVVAELRTLMPRIYITYVADDEFRPYGEKTEAQLKQRLPGLLQTLVLATNPDAVVIACNTASTTALGEIRDALNIPVVGVVPAIKPAAQMSTTKTIAVLGTPGTVKRKYVDRLVSDFGNGCQVVLHGSSALVSLAEEKLSGKHVSAEKISAEITPMFLAKGGADIDVVVLACTHFPLLLDGLKSKAPRKVRWVDSGAAIAKRTQSVLEDLPPNSTPNMPQTALLIGGQIDKVRIKTFAEFGFPKMVIL
jgi:glutamate racemase